VQVNGQVETQRRKKLRPGDRVEFAGEVIEIGP
jgi:ribosome-associated protein YbcJ (S4-like RNA binding protein)